MAKYIKLEDAIKEAKAWSMYVEDDLVSRLGRLPSMEIVRCKDCKYSEEVKTKGVIICKRLLQTMIWADNAYCSYGERKEQGVIACEIESDDDSHLAEVFEEYAKGAEK